MTIQKAGNDVKPNGSDERPGLVFLSFLAGMLLGTLLFYGIAYRSWYAGERYESDSENVSQEEIKALPNGISGYRFRLFGLIIEERCSWNDIRPTESTRLPGGHWPWVTLFGFIGALLSSFLCWKLLYSRQTMTNAL